MKVPKNSLNVKQCTLPPLHPQKLHCRVSSNYFLCTVKPPSFPAAARRLTRLVLPGGGGAGGGAGQGLAGQGRGGDTLLLQVEDALECLHALFQEASGLDPQGRAPWGEEGHGQGIHTNFNHQH